MKKYYALLVASSLIGGAVADLDVNFQNNTVTVVTPAEEYVSGTVDVQLLWSAGVPSFTAGINGSWGANEYLLTSVTSVFLQDGLFDGAVAGAGLGQFLDSHVGGNDINSGYIYARFFDNTAKTEGDWYLQFTLAGPDLVEYNADPRPTPYLTATLLPGAGSAGPTSNSFALNDATYGHQVIPEPAVASLIGIFGMGIIFTKRIFGKA